MIKHIQTLGDIEEYELESNGLRILLKEEHSAPVVTVMVSYEIGSVNEQKGFSGAAHLLEHMMFKGTDKYHREKNTQIAHLLESVGAVMNANTGHDATHYYEMLPGDRLELALDIEASRMANCKLSQEDFDSEKQVVLNELERYFDNPTVSLSTEVWQKTFPGHGYDHPIIGWRKDVEEMPVEELRRLYEIYYSPTRAKLTLIGDFQTEKTLQLIAQKFSDIQSSKLDDTPKTNVSEACSPGVVEVKRPSGSQTVMLAHRMPGVLHEDTLALDILGMILGRGKTSRLFKKLVQTDLAASVDSGGMGTRDPGLFVTFATLIEHVKHAAVEKIILETYAAIQQNGVTPEELIHALGWLKSEQEFARDGSFALAMELSHAIAGGDWKHFVNYFERAQKVSCEQIQRVAQKYLVASTNVIGRILVELNAKRMDLKGASINAQSDAHQRSIEKPLDLEKAELPEAIQKLMQPSASIQPTGWTYQERVRQVEHDQFHLMTVPTKSENIVHLAGCFDFAGTAYHANPLVPGWTASMLDKGTRNFSKFEIAEQLESCGARIHFSLDAEHLQFRARCLKNDLELVLKLLSDELQSPAFLPDEFERIRSMQKVAIQNAMASTSAQGHNLFLRRLVAQDHMHRVISYEQQLEDIEKISLEEVSEFYENFYGKQNFLLIVAGDYDEDGLKKNVTQYFQHWKTNLIEPKKSLGVNEKAPAGYEKVRVKGVVNYDVFIGHPMPLTVHSPDYLAAYVACYILGGDFTARLSNIIRDRYGFTYGIRSGLTGCTEKVTGLWTTHLIVNPKHLDEAVEKTKEELYCFVREGVSKKELETKKQTIAGKFKVSLATSEALAEQVLQVKQRELGVAYLDSFPKLVEALELDQVNEVIRRYYKPEKMHVVAAGS